jgi:hypothetical protein
MQMMLIKSTASITGDLESVERQTSVFSIATVALMQ